MSRVISGTNDLATVRPDVAAQFHPTKNGDLTPDRVAYGSHSKVWWICEKGHEWQTSPNKRTHGDYEHGCPYCSGRKVLAGFNDLASQNPAVAAEWHPTKNGDLTPDRITKSSQKKVWWQCSEGHEWQDSIDHRNRGIGCPYCSNHRVLKGFNDLAFLNPELAAEWHPTKNGDLTPDKVLPGSGQKVWWLGKCGHEWKAQINNRNNGAGCPVCDNKTILPGENDLATTHPELAAQWHPTKNGALQPSELSAGSKKEVWWKGECGHEWKSSPNKRTSSKNGCPKCAREAQTSFPEQAIFYYLNQLSPALNRYKHNERTEIDVYLPELGFGVEYDGRFHDTEAASQRDARKDAALADAGITLIRVKEVIDFAGCVDTEAIIYCKKSANHQFMGEVLQKLIARLNMKTGQGFAVDIDVERDRWKIYAQYIENKKQNSLAARCPELVAEWHPTKNGTMQPQHFSFGSNHAAWWKCSACGHEWPAKIYNRTKGHGCPICGLKKRGETRKQNIKSQHF